MAGELVLVVDDEPNIRELCRMYLEHGGQRVETAGLGLAIGREIVAAHGGQLSVEPVPAQGTCFVVKLPLAATAAPGKVPISA